MKENSREEDIKDIEKYISFTSKRENFSHDTDWNWNKDLANKIEHILSDYKRVLEMNEVLLKENEELKEENEYNKLLLELNNNFTIDKKTGNYKWNVIEIQKIKDKIEDLKMSGGSDGKDNTENTARELAIEALQDILEESEE